MLKINKTHGGDKGLTLIELLITIAVLAIVAAIAIPVVTNVVGSANDRAATQTQSDIADFVEKYKKSGAYTYSDGVFKGYVDLNGDGDVTEDEKIEELVVDTDKFSVAIDPGGDTPPSDTTGDNFYGTTPNTTFTVEGSSGGESEDAGGGAITVEGTPDGWGQDSDGTLNNIPNLSNVTALAAGTRHALALKSDGTVVGWGVTGGFGYSGQTDVPGDLSDVIDIAAGTQHSVALKSDGTVEVWGDSFNGQQNKPTGLSDVTAIAAGYNHTLALKSNGTVAAWGDDSNGQSTVPAGLSGVTAIAAAKDHSVAVKSDGTVVSWGDTGTHNFSGFSDAVDVATGGDHTLVLNSDGTVGATGNNSNGFAPGGQTDVPSDLSDVIAIAAGNLHSVAVKSDGTVVAWGADLDGSVNDASTFSGVVYVAAGSDNYTLAIISE